MAVIETWYNQDLQKPVSVHYLSGSLFSHNGNGNRIGVHVFNNGVPVTLSGTVSGYVVIADGSTVPCTGTRSGNSASILIPAAAYQPGPVFITIFITDGSTVTTIASVATSVMMARTENQVSPGTAVQDWTQTINAAMQSVQTTADNIGGNVAVPYANITYPVPLGKYAYYNGGLYRCISPIASSETFTPAHWTTVRLGDDVSDLKSAIDNNITDIGCVYQSFAYTGEAHSSSKDKAYIRIGNGKKFYLSIDSVSAVNCQIFAFYNDGTSERIATTTTTKADRVEFTANKDIVSISVYLGPNLTPQTITFTIETENSIFETVKVIDSNTKQSADDILVANNKGLQRILPYGNFQSHGLNPDGSFTTEQRYRVSNDDKMSFDYDITVNVANGFKWGYIPFVNNVAGTWSGWKTTPYTIPAGIIFNVQIARVSEVYTEIADVKEFTDAITISTIALSRIVSLENTVNKHFDYSYNGKMIESKKGRYNMIQSNLFVPTPASISATSLQGFGIANGYIVQMYSGTTGKLSIVNMANGSVVASIDSNCEHGNAIDFFDRYYSDDDILPVALVSDGLTNRAYEARITSSAVTILKNIIFPVETAGHFVSTMLDKNNLIVYTVGYKQNSYNDATNNNMIICAWDYNNLADNGDNTYTPEFIKSFNVPFFTTLQGPTFHNGKLFIISSVSSMTEANTRIFVINPYEERIENVLTQFPDNIKNVECEAMYFYETDNNVIIYVRSLGSTLPYYIMEFNS